MKKIVKFLSLVSLALIVVAGSSFAGTIGTNITIYDKMGPTGEDNEAEVGMVQSQVWDLEGFFLNGNILSMVGGFNFSASAPGYSFTSGDIFIGKNGNVVFGNQAPAYTNPVIQSTWTGQNIFGYDYAIRMNFANNSYTIYKIDNNTILSPVYYQYPTNAGSDPWKVASGWIEEKTETGLLFTGPIASNNTMINGYGLQGWGGNDDHYVVTGIDLSFLPYKDFTAHFTMQCGNDNLMGAVPEPTTFVLLGLGLVGLAGYTRFTKKS
jgi:hypothetical protein